MKTVLRLVSFLALLAALPSAHASNLNGDWRGSFEFNGSSVPLTLHLTVANGVLTGTVEGLPTTPAEIHEGKLDGNSVTFWLNTDYQGQTYKLICKGTVAAAGDAIAFTMGTEDGSWNTDFTAQRAAAPATPAAADVTGNWKGAFDFQGNSVPLTFHLAAAQGAVTGTVEGLETSPAEIHDGKIDGDTVTFWLNTDYQGQTYKLVYTGKVANGQIDFTFGTEDGSWSTQLTAAKSL